MNDAQNNYKPEIHGPMVEFLEHLLAEAKAGNINTMTAAWVNGKGQAVYRNIGNAVFPMYMTLHEAADYWRKLVFTPPPPPVSPLILPRGPLPPNLQG